MAWAETHIPQEHHTLLNAGEWVWGDSAYPLCDWCQAPYKKYNLMSSTPRNTDELYVGQRKTPKIIQPSTTMSRKFVYVQNIALAFLKDGGLHCEAYGVPLTPQRVYSLLHFGSQHAFTYMHLLWIMKMGFIFQRTSSSGQE